VSEDFAFGTVLLSCEHIRDGVGSVNVCGPGKHGVKAADAHMEGNILEAEGGVIGCGARVFPRTKEEVEGNGAHVSDGLVIGKKEVTKGLLKNVYDDDDGHWFHA
jgi:hypothetical protein